MGYSDNLCKLMNEKGISSYKLAKDIGVHVSTISNWKDGRAPKVEHLKLVADYFGVTLDELLIDEQDQSNKNTVQ